MAQVQSNNLKGKKLLSLHHNSSYFMGQSQFRQVGCTFQLFFTAEVQVGHFALRLTIKNISGHAVSELLVLLGAWIRLTNTWMRANADS